jgi:hypothetical protein
VRALSALNRALDVVFAVWDRWTLGILGDGPPYELPAPPQPSTWR